MLKLSSFFLHLHLSLCLQFQYNVSPLHYGNITSINARVHVHVSSETRKRDTSFVSMYNVHVCVLKKMNEIYRLAGSVTTDWNGLTRKSTCMRSSFSLSNTLLLWRENTEHDRSTLSANAFCMAVRCVDFAWFANPCMSMVLSEGVQPFLPSRLNVVTHSFDVWEEIFVRALLIQ